MPVTAKKIAVASRHIGNEIDRLLHGFPNRGEQWDLLLLIERDDLRTFLDRLVRENDAQFDALRGDVIGGVGDGIAGVRRKIPRLRARLEIAALRLPNIASLALAKRRGASDTS